MFKDKLYQRYISLLKQAYDSNIPSVYELSFIAFADGFLQALMYTDSVKPELFTSITDYAIELKNKFREYIEKRREQ